MADKPFRVLLDLTDLYLLNFKYVWINISPRELKTISDFKTSLLRKINLDRKDIKLFVRDGLLLEEETIIVLREDDTVKVQYEDPSQLPEYTSNNESKKSSRKRSCYEYNMNEHNVPLNKRCKTAIEISNESKKSSILEKKSDKKKKHKLSNSVSLDIVDYENLESNHNAVQSQKRKDKKKSASLGTNITESNLSEKHDSFFSFDVADATAEQLGNKTFSEGTEPGNVTFDLKESSPKTNGVKNQEVSEMDASELFAPNTVVKKAEVVNNCPKKKRKRHKKRKHTQCTVETTHNTDSKFTSFSDSIDENSKRKHVIYSPVPSEKDSLLTCNDANEVKDSPKDTFVVIKNSSTVDAQSFKSYPKISTPAQSDGCINPSWHVSLMQHRDFAYNNELPSHKKEVEQDKLIVKNMCQHQQNSEEEKFPADEMQYDDLPAVNSMPNIGTCIAYKALELDESYSPVISEYREGVIKNVNPETEEIEIELLKHIIKPGKIGKFENLKKDEFPSPEIIRCEILRWSDIISPKQLS